MSATHPEENIVRLAIAQNLQEAYLLRDALEDADIRASVVGEYVENALGELPSTLPEVWVPEANLKAAREIYENHGSIKKIPADHQRQMGPPHKGHPRDDNPSFKKPRRPSK